jgi:hypothetical protein
MATNPDFRSLSALCVEGAEFIVVGAHAPIALLSLPDLLTNKRSVARPQDLLALLIPKNFSIDVEACERLEDEPAERAPDGADGRVCQDDRGGVDGAAA